MSYLKSLFELIYNEESLNKELLEGNERVC